eukprot:1307776-Rhodomonas_salina.2
MWRIPAHSSDQLRHFHVACFAIYGYHRGDTQAEMEQVHGEVDDFVNLMAASQGGGWPSDADMAAVINAKSDTLIIFASYFTRGHSRIGICCFGFFWGGLKRVCLWNQGSRRASGSHRADPQPPAWHSRVASGADAGLISESSAIPGTDFDYADFASSSTSRPNSPC